MEIQHSKLTTLVNHDVILEDFVQYLLFNQMLCMGPIDLNKFTLPSEYETFRMLWAEDLQCPQQFSEFDTIANTTIDHGLPLPQGFFNPLAKPRDEEWDGLTHEQITMATNLTWYAVKELELQQAAKACNYALHEERHREKKLARARSDSDDLTTTPLLTARTTPVVTTPVHLDGLLDPPEELPEAMATASTAVALASTARPTHLLDIRFTKKRSTKGKAPVDAPVPSGSKDSMDTSGN
ncbi:hypothetical protein WOLCODRAFT_148044 [Wolfiporia cocos MD-104 SS10]|uniref:Uncharacterized protein n=1 Tax=Wolfiporia cocos (strain MD-104) TaxID=742152 RepID=A0A2H3IVG3_WOLCO|nr:hypothetical protein WOLCODRAFT_148044 [Wolfiporia cocos MD-104 SS10]